MREKEVHGGDFLHHRGDSRELSDGSQLGRSHWNRAFGADTLRHNVNNSGARAVSFQLQLSCP